MRRVTTVVLAAALALAAVLRSHLVPLVLLTVMGVAVGVIVAVDSGDPRGVVRYPLLGGVVVLVAVGIGQLGSIGLVAGGLLLALLVVRRERVQ